jgi:Protein of unknown function (DUF1800)
MARPNLRAVCSFILLFTLALGRFLIDPVPGSAKDFGHSSALNRSTAWSNVVVPEYVGYLDYANCSDIGGWAADVNGLNTSVDVDIFDGANRIATVTANISRPDVGAYLGDNGLHGFNISTPATLLDGQAHSITARVAGSNTDLSNSPRSLTCTTSNANHVGYLDYANCSVIGGWAANLNNLSSSVSVDIFDGSNKIATTIANLYRPDVGAFLGDDGLHGFNISTPVALRDGQTHSVTARVTGETADLLGTPKNITCSATVITQADAVRFLEQSTFGPTTPLIAQVRNVGFDAFLEEQFNTPASSYPTLPLFPTTPPTDCPTGSICRRDNYSMYLLQNRFFTNALYGPDQLRQRVAFALHQIIVVSGVDITQPSWMAPYLQTLDRNAFGNFRQLLYEITLNPAMGNYLDMANNTRTNPNENYAREILQLFSIGTVRLNQDGTLQLDELGQPIPTYDQNTVNNFARVFTGWRLAPPPVAGTPNYIDPMQPNQTQHDTAAKTLLRGVTLPAGQTAVQDLNDALDNIFTDPNVAPFISKQLIQHLVTSNPSPAYVQRISSVFNDNGAGVRGDLRAVVRAILLDSEARGDLKTDPRYGHLKHPAQLIANLLRAFTARSADGTTTSDGYLNPQAVNMGMDLFRPPSVFSYFSPAFVVPRTQGVRGPEFGILSTSTTLRRANFVNTLVFSSIPVGTNSPNGTSLDFSAIQPLAGNPAQLVDALNTLMMHGSMSPDMRSSIISAVSTVSSTNPLKRARTAVYLVATSSQYQVER